MLGKIAATTMLGGALTVGMAGSAFACGDGGHSGQQSSDQGQRTAPDQNRTWSGHGQWGSDQNRARPDDDRFQGRATKDDDATTTTTTSQSNNPVTASDQTPPTSPSTTGTSGTSTAATPSSFCADASTFEAWISQRETSITHRIAALTAREGSDSADGDTTAVATDQHRINRLNVLLDFLRAADTQLMTACSSA
jgi:hypothetical protein